MRLLMISGDRSLLLGRKAAFWYTLEELRKHFERIDIICPRVRTKAGEANRASVSVAGEGASVFLHPSPWGLLSQPTWIRKRGEELFREHGFDTMTVHEFPPFYNGIGARSLHRETGIPYALEIHHIVGVPRAATWSEAVGRSASQLFLRFDAAHAAKVRVVNRTVRSLLGRWGVPEEKIAIVPSFYLDLDKESRLRKPPASYDCSFCGRLVPNKGLSTLLRAVAMIPECRLLIVGDGPERSKLEGLARSLGMEERVTFLGWLSRNEDVFQAIQTARIFVMNSLSEGGPRSVLEAMACGMPVIATNVGIVPDVIRDGENGVITDGTPGDLAEKIRYLLQDDAFREKIGSAAREIAARFERRTLITAYAEFLKSLRT